MQPVICADWERLNLNLLQMFVELNACLLRGSRSPNVPSTRVCLQQGRCVYSRERERGEGEDQFVSNTFLASGNAQCIWQVTMLSWI